MPHQRILLAMAVAGLALSFLGGCGLAPSIHPLSDEKSTVLDARLLGRWYALDESGEPQQERFPDLVYVGRSKTSEKELEVLWVEREGEHLSVKRLRVRTTKIGEHHYLSATSDDLTSEEEEPRPVWLLARYRVSSPDVLELRLLDAAFVGNAIRAGQLDGQVEIPEGMQDDPEPEYESVLIEAATPKLRAWVAANAEAAFASARPGRLRRAKTPDEEHEPEDDE